MNNDKLIIARETIRRKLELKRIDRERTRWAEPPKYDEEYYKGLEWLDSLARDDNLPPYVMTPEQIRMLKHNQRLPIVGLMILLLMCIIMCTSMFL
jgi:hypothetical protein